MQLVVRHVQTIRNPTTCEKCDGPIDGIDDPKFVRISLGSRDTNFHEDCFENFCNALLEFHRVFINERQGEYKERLH